MVARARLCRFAFRAWVLWAAQSARQKRERPLREFRDVADTRANPLPKRQGAERHQSTGKGRGCQVQLISWGRKLVDRFLVLPCKLIEADDI